MPEAKYEVYRSRWQITERRGGATYKTKFLDNVWLPFDENHPVPNRDPENKDIIYSTVSDEEMKGIQSPRRRQSNA